MPATRIVVNIPDEKAYDVRVGSGIIENLGSRLREIEAVANSPQLLVISDDQVAPLYLDQVKSSLKKARYQVSDIVIPAGESSKSLELAGEIWEAMAGLGIGRDCGVVALGGGVVGDLAGFVGSTFMRGLPVVQVPTTLLAMVDSSVGGKTGVNLEAGKNLVGTFHQPVYVCADVDTLQTLTDREWRCGLAEIAKASVIDSDDFFFWMLDEQTALSERKVEAVNEAITRSVIFKAGVVAADKTESHGVRECLNYGHTLGHAIEVLAGYGTFSHGQAVAEGMRFAARLAHRLLGTSSELVQTQDQLLDGLGLNPVVWSASPEAMLNAMKKDKKVRGARVRFVLPRDIGVWETQEVGDELLLEALGEWQRTKQILASNA